MAEWTMDRLLLHPAQALRELNGHDRRVTDLLEANNRYLQEARDARAGVKALEAELRLLRMTLKVTH